MESQILTNKEKVVFEVLASTGAVSATQIAKVSSLNRTALYHTLKLLINKGLVFQIKKNETTLFQAVDLEDFKLWTKKRIKEFEDVASKITNSYNNVNHPVLHSGIRYFEGVEGVKKLYSETWRENTGKKIMVITDYKKAYETMGKFFNEEYFPLRVTSGVKVQSLLSLDAYAKKDMSRAGELLRDMRFSDIFKDLGIEINIFDDNVAIVAFDKKSPMGMIIKNTIISNAFKKIFTYLWDDSKKTKTPVRVSGAKL